MEGQTELPLVHITKTEVCADLLCKSICKQNVNMCVPWYLMACLAYDLYDDPIITDGCFDWVSTLMNENWQTIDHRHKHFIKCSGEPHWKGSSVHILCPLEELPLLIRDTTLSRIREQNEKQRKI